ncbi:uncharacterized protein CEXT_136861 [Caerostris extrusa]|uniref:Uncharacterized protein n=1 Tax=Caerostris extrusa TaxID=172846 RepID=A0AAV4PMV6_CAEEX|nr:uncharacterized protein CEXT_136861 [Caerostris extrusa]
MLTSMRIVTKKKKMIHGHCSTLNPNSPCMTDRKCSKGLSRILVSNTVTGNGRYPLYRRRSVEDGDTLETIQMRNGDVEVDNCWVVP